MNDRDPVTFFDDPDIRDRAFRFEEKNWHLMKLEYYLVTSQITAYRLKRHLLSYIGNESISSASHIWIVYARIKKSIFLTFYNLCVSNHISKQEKNIEIIAYKIIICFENIFILLNNNQFEFIAGPKTSDARAELLDKAYDASRHNRGLLFLLKKKNCDTLGLEGIVWVGFALFWATYIILLKLTRNDLFHRI